MSQETIFRCDICKQIEPQGALIRVEITRNHFCYGKIKLKHVSFRYDMCIKCAKGIGFEVKEEIKQEPKLETTADQLYALVTELVSEIVEEIQ